MKSLIVFFAKRSFLVNLISSIVVIFGVFVFVDMKRDLIPGMEFNIVNVTATLRGASAIDMEKYVTFPIEESISNFAGVEKTESTTQNGSVSIRLSFLASHDNMSEAVEDIKTRIDGLKDKLPPGLDPIEVSRTKVDSIKFLSLITLGVNETHGIDRAWVKSLADSIKKLPGIVDVKDSLQKREIHIDFDPTKLSRYGLSVTEIRQVLTNALRFSPVGSLRTNEKSISVEIRKGLGNIESIRQLPISGNRSGQRVSLSQVASVDFGFPDRHRLEQVDGRDIVELEVFKDTQSDSIKLRNQIQEILQSYEKRFPEHLSAQLLGDGPYFIEKQLNVLKNNGASGLLLVLFSLYLFLGFRVSLMTAMGIPLAYMGTLIVLSYLGVSIDLISVVGLILVIGILVDDAIIVAERYVQNLEEGMIPLDAAVSAAHSTIIPVTGTVITTIVAFAPILLIKSSLSTVLFAIPVVIISALLFSWFESFFILPNHLQHFVKSKSKRSGNSLFQWLFTKYRRVLGFVLKWRYISLVFLLLFTGFSIYWAATHVKKDFNLSIGAERILVSAVLKKSSSLEETTRLLKPLNDHLMSYKADGLNFVYSEVGDVRIQHKDRKGYRFANFYLFIEDKISKPVVARKKIEKKLKEKLDDFKTEQFELLSIKSYMAGDENKKDDVITIFVSGGDQLSFDAVQAEIQTALKGTDFVKPRPIGAERIQESWQFHIDKNQLIRYKMNYSELIGQLGEAFSPQELGQLRISGETITLYTQFKKSFSPKFKNLSSLKVITQNGLSVPLSTLGKWKKVEVLKKIEHKDRLRKFEIDIEFDKEKVKKEVVAENVRAAIEPLRTKYPAYNFTVHEENEESRRAKAWAIRIGAACVLLVILVLALVLNSLIQPLIVAFAIPFGVIGLIWALYFHGLPLGLMAIIGLIGMAGVVVNDSLIMVDSINQEMKKRSVRDAIIEGASGRLRSIILTTVTTLGGVFPMAYGVGGESGFTQPLAFSLGWGLTFATVLTLFVLPSLLEIKEDIGELLSKVLVKLRLRSAKTY